MMNTKLLAAGLLLSGVVAATATLNVSSDGSDGVLNPTANSTVIDLSLATTGTCLQAIATHTP